MKPKLSFIIVAEACLVLMFSLCTPVIKPLPDRAGRSGTQLSAAYRELGHLLFFDKNLSYGKNLACSSCHDPSLAFTDGYQVSVNARAEKLLRNAPTLLNLQNRKSFNWANSKIVSLRQQMERPLFGQHPPELGLNGHEEEILQRFSKDKKYRPWLKACYAGYGGKLTMEMVKDAIAAYISGLESRQSPYDRFLENGDSLQLSAQAWKGFKLFRSDSIDCAACHGGKDFFEPDRGGEFANIGLYNCGGSYPDRDPGLQAEDGDKEYNGVFRIPTLRNVAITAPYYHDGSENSLDRILRNYERQGRLVDYGDCRGDGSQHPLTDGRMQKFSLDDGERQAIIAFLQSLTDTSYLADPYFRNPFE